MAKENTGSDFKILTVSLLRSDLHARETICTHFETELDKYPRN